MKTKISLAIILLFFMLTNLKAQDPFKLYKERDKSWNGAIFQIYIKQYAGIDVNKTMLEGGTTSDIENELIDNSGTLTTDMDKAIEAVINGKKVFFFIENAVFGGLERGTTFSGSWQKKFPLCSGFYIWNDSKCFQNEGLNYHCGKKDKAHEVRYVIMNL